MARDPKRGWESPPEQSAPEAGPAGPQLDQARTVLAGLLQRAQERRAGRSRQTRSIEPHHLLPHESKKTGARRSVLGRTYQVQGETVQRGSNPIWPLLLVLLLLGGVALGLVSWLNREAAEPEPAAPSRPAMESVTPGSETARSATAGDDEHPVVADVPPPEPVRQDEPPPTATAPERPAAVSVAPTPPAAPAPERPAAVAVPPAPPVPVPEVAPKQPSPVPTPPATATAPPPAEPAPAGREGPMLGKEMPAALASALATLGEKPSREALAVIAEHAEAGWPQAQTALGLQHAKGDAIGRDFKKALELFQRAAAQDDAEAQYYLGYAYLTGSGVAADPVTALAWFIIAASRGQAEALTERDRGLASLSKDERSRAINMAGNLPSEVAAGWSRDPANGTAVWLPSWFRNGSYALRIEVPAEAGYAHGIGKIVLRSSQAGSSDRSFEGRFYRGYFHGERVREEEVHFLPTDDVLFRLPDSADAAYRGSAFWLRVDFGVQIAADPCYVAINRYPDILATVPDGFSTLDDTAVQSVMHEGWRLYTELCPEQYQADAYVVPRRFTYLPQRSRMIPEYSPLFAKAHFYGKRGEELSVGQFENFARRTHERAEQEAKRQRERAAREEKRRQAEAAAQTRGSPDVRGLRLGMTLAEVRELFRAEIVEWTPPWRPDKPPPPYKQFEQRFRLADGAGVDASFTSSVHGMVLFAFSYEQNFRDGVAATRLEADLKAKYGEPDDMRGGGHYWTYTLVSRKPEEVLGAFLKVTIRDMEAPGKISFLRLVVNDAGFGSYDERAAYAAELEAKRKAFEAGKSDRPKF